MVRGGVSLDRLCEGWPTRTRLEFLLVDPRAVDALGLQGVAVQESVKGLLTAIEGYKEATGMKPRRIRSSED